MRLFLVRHGQSEGNISRPDAPQDPGLTELGVAQAEGVVDAFLKEPVTALYASPMTRTLQTALPMSKEFELAVRVRPELAETTRREWNMPYRFSHIKKSGLAMSEVSEQFPNTELPGNVQPDKEWWQALVGEDRSQAFARARIALDMLVETHPGSDETIVVVTHGAFGSVMISAAIGCPLSDYNRFSMYNCGISSLRNTREETKLRFCNSVEHLAVSLRTDLT